MSFKALVSFSVIGVEEDRKAVCQRYHRLRFDVATVFAYRFKRNDIESGKTILDYLVHC